MTKYSTIIAILICVAFSGNSFASDSKPVAGKTVEYKGPTDLSDTVIENAAVFGPLKANNITAKSLVVHGPFKGNTVKINTLSVFGPVDLKEATCIEKVEVKGPLKAIKSNFNDDATVYGPVKAFDSQFIETLTIYADQSEFSNVELNRLVIKDQKSKKRQVLNFTNSKVKEIVFESGDGFIISDPNSAIQSVKGGQLQNCRNR